MYTPDFFSLVKVESSLSPKNLVLLTTNLFNFLIAERFRDCKGILAMIFIDSSFWGGQWEIRQTMGFSSGF